MQIYIYIELALKDICESAVNVTILLEYSNNNSQLLPAFGSLYTWESHKYIYIKIYIIFIFVRVLHVSDITLSS